MDMRLVEDYMSAAYKTAIYPTHVRGLYPTLGLVGECSEFVTAYRMGGSWDRVLKEAGDVMWYLNAMCIDFGVSLVTAWQDFVPERHQGLEYEVEIFRYCGELCELIKKSFRDGDGTLPPEKKHLFTSAIGHIMISIGGIMDEAGSGYEMADVLAENIAKLKSRQKRGKLHGDGDER